MTMAQPPDDRADDGLTAELRAQLEESAEDARRFAAALEHQRAVRQLVSAYQAGRAACPEGYAVVAAAVDWAHAGIGRARPHRPISQPALRTLFGRHLEQLRPGRSIRSTVPAAPTVPWSARGGDRTASLCASFSAAQQGVAFRGEDCGPRREGAIARPVGEGGV